MNKTQLEQDIEYFPFWNMEFQRVQHYWHCAQGGSLPWGFVVGVLNNYVIFGILPSQGMTEEVILLRDIAQLQSQ